MAKTISVADDVYEWMKKNKKSRSFSELIRSLESKKTNFSEVNGLGVTKDMDKVKKSIDSASKKSMGKIKNLEGY